MATDNKYDRQLRLWGAKGQKALSESTVILIRATAAGTETLKNLVLPGIGEIVVLDDVTTADSDRDSNFFVDPSAPNRAQGATELLQELNPDVKGQWKHVPEGLQQFDLETFFKSIPATEPIDDDNKNDNTSDNNTNAKLYVVGADLEPPLARKVSAVCDEMSLSLILVQSYGLIGTVRLQTPPLPIMDPKPDSEVPDLRLVHPFPALKQLFMDVTSSPWDSLTGQEHGHIPYPLLLLKLMDEWKDSHGGNSPLNFDEKQQFRSAIQKASRNYEMELNFQEAASNAYLAYTERTLEADHLQELQKKANGVVGGSVWCPHMTALLQALDGFTNSHNGQPPLMGNIPDMTASTDLYVKLQKAYQEQAAADMAEMRRRVPDHIDTELVETFTKNIYNLDLLHTRTWTEEEGGERTTTTTSSTNDYPEDLLEDLVMATMDPYEVKEHTPLLWYLALRACHVYYDEHGRFPGTNTNNTYEDEIPVLQDCIERVVTRYGLKDNELVQQTLLNTKDELAYATEMTRYGNAQVHNVASVVGGVASQEAVKIITGIYVPLNNTYVFNGIASIGGVHKF